MMNRLPEIGERVRYSSSDGKRAAAGTVVRIFEGYAARCDCRDADICNHPESFWEVGEPGWQEHWAATVRVDERPDWWMWGDDLRFAPAIATLEPE